MQISKETIIEKMVQEIEKAKTTQSTKDMAGSMSHIKLLSELWLEEYQKQGNFESSSVKNVPSPRIHEAPPKQDLSADQQQIITSATKEINEEKDDLSIFDF